MESEHDQIPALSNSESPSARSSRQYWLKVESIRPSFVSSLFLLREFCYDFDQALHEYLRPFLEALGERTAAFRSALSSQVETSVKALRQSMSSQVSRIEQLLSSSAAVSHSVSTSSNPVDPSSPFSAYFCLLTTYYSKLSPTVNFAFPFSLSSLCSCR